jgi:hypothetical protein
MRPYKYAMPMDPRVLEYDFESDDSVDDIPHIVKILRSVDDTTYPEVRAQVNSLVYDLWGNIEKRIGINLKDREKLLPVFREFSRLSRKYSKTPRALYRGVSMPEVYESLLEDTFGNQVGKINLDLYRNIKTIFENLAYGLRSWTLEEKKAQGFGNLRDYDSEIIVFHLHKTDDIVLDGNALIQLINESRGTNYWEPIPVDRQEYIVYLVDPKILSATRHLIGDTYVWNIIVE